MMSLPKSKLVKSQTLTFTKDSGSIDKAVCTSEGVEYRKVIINIRFDDRCGNGHNTFSVTGDSWCVGDRLTENNKVCGCIHEILTDAFPEHHHLIKWHLVSTDGPMHYIADTLYHARDTNTSGKKAARNCAVWENATLEQLQDKEQLQARLPSLMNEFKSVIESLGMEY